ncbi:glycoside hydrolase family 3 C-terminal domain-containing protein [Streptomyces violaceusniger]|uniref:Exo-alpha-(1->6)-L-arabinopyranosidase n=1 Tax=Streptomyces violaceusniger (strain Tu 4113) TaxID=653045 RepID=G2P4X3_STRV4|nr:glycoside hydrolase family 3 C-terminal domain-containing protein [Streptomyces violaceusniger]AEM84150.1 glycoside hydrolase family 3 domain protein [Streptomyces violaceusniger Tu 4113]
MQQPDPAALPLERKVSLLSGGDFWSTQSLDEAGVPAVVLTDGPHGARRQQAAADHLGFHASEPSTCFPPAVAVGSSWDPELAARVGEAVGREARALGVGVILGPGVNIKRSPLCGRNFEYYSEDPLLSGVLGAAFVRGLQTQGVGAAVKHFAANNQETDRMRVSADVDERTLREIYLAAFEHIITQARPASVMAAYNRINGAPASESTWLLTQVLREEWGFEGAVVSDWGGVGDRVAALAAGVDLQMPGPDEANDAAIMRAVRDGVLEEALVDASVRRVAALAELAAAPVVERVESAGHHALARKLAADCVVLLKNDKSTLPLAEGVRLAVIGEFAADPQFQGGGSSLINATHVDSPLEAIRTLGHPVTYAPGFTTDGTGDPKVLREEAVRIARGVEVAVVFVGLRGESEGSDRAHLDLPADQVELVRAVSAVAPHTVVVLSTGGVVSLEGWHDDVDAIVAGWLLGQASGGTLADVLSGAVNPSGHLAESIPLRLEDNPSYLTFPGEAGHVRYGEGVMVGYRHYETVGRTVRYPFGYGLSYTTYRTDEMSVDVTGDDTATVRLRATNTGDRPGKHVIQVYVATSAGRVRRPVRELRAFTKVGLRSGESRVVELPLERRSFAYYDVEGGRWVVAPGAYTVQIGESAARVVAEQTVTLTGDTDVTPLSLDSAIGDWFAHPVAGPLLQEALMAGATEEQRQQAEANSDLMEMVASIPARQYLHFPGVPVSTDDLTEILEATR